MVSFFLREIAQQLSRPRIRGPPRGGFIKPFCLQLHQLRFLLHGLQAEGPHQPNRAASDKPADVLPTNQGHMSAETSLVQIEETVSVGILILAHPREFLRLFRVPVPQTFGEVVINPGILFLLGDRQGKYFPLGESIE